MATVDLSQYGITGATEIVHNPSYDELYKEEMKDRKVNLALSTL